jgi:hypothetical protein
MLSGLWHNKRAFGEVSMSGHRDGREGQQRMKAMTVALLTLIENRSQLSPAQLEAKFELGLRESYEYETGQEWRRYRHPPSNNRKLNQALSNARLFEVARLARELGYVSEADLWEIGFGKLEPAEVFMTRLDDERSALAIFRRGKALLAAGKMPLPPGGKKGGRPRSARSDAEMLSNYQSWIATIRQLGGDVFDDREGPELSARDEWLREFTDASAVHRALTDDDFALLDHSEQPFDPRRPNGEALARLRVRFSYGWVDEPRVIKYRPLKCRPNAAQQDDLSKTDAEVGIFVQWLENDIARSVHRRNT